MPKGTKPWTKGPGRPGVLLALLLLSIGANLLLGHRLSLHLAADKAREERRGGRVSVREELFLAMPRDSGDIVLLGDSHFELFPANELLGSARVRNRGLSGQTVRDLLGRAAHIAEGRPRMVVLLVGVNDIGQGRSEREYARDMDELMDAFGPGHTKLAVVSIPPNTDPGIQRKIMRFNDALRERCAERGVPFVDLDPHLLADEGLDPALSLDGRHLNGPGYLRLAEALRPLIATLQ